MISSQINISLYHDLRRIKGNGMFPVKLRVFIPYPRMQKLYPTKVELSEDQFQLVLKGKRLSEELFAIRQYLVNFENKANTIANSMEHFRLEEFESLLFTKPSAKLDLTQLYESAINLFLANGQVNSANSYKQSLVSLKKIGGENLSIYEITPSWLKSYERDLIQVQEKSLTTVGFYLRPLRKIFNDALERKLIKTENYPFGKKKYIIPAPRSTKKALAKDQLSLLFHGTPADEFQMKAKAFWFFSYSSNGMNMKDILKLKYSDLTSEAFTFNRVKTLSTNKSQQETHIFLNEFTKNVIAKYGNPSKFPGDYIFPVLEPKISPTELQRRVGNFVRFVNQHFASYCKHLGIDSKVSTYTARHSFATMAIRTGSSVEQVSEALAHSSISTTKVYLAGFGDDAKKELQRKIIDL